MKKLIIILVTVLSLCSCSTASTFYVKGGRKIEVDTRKGVDVENLSKEVTIEQLKTEYHLVSEEIRDSLATLYREGTINYYEFNKAMNSNNKKPNKKVSPTIKSYLDEIEKAL